MFSSNYIKGFAVLALGLLVAVTMATMAANDGPDGDEPTFYTGDNITVGRGVTAIWTPEFTSGYTGITLAVAGSSTAMPTTTNTNDFNSSCGTATTVKAEVISGKIQIKVSQNCPDSISKYYVKVRAEAANPIPTVKYYEITVNVETLSFSYNPSSVVADVGTAITLTPSINSSLNVSSYSIDKDLPAGLSLDTSTGVISGTPTAYKAQTDYIVTATGNVTMTATVSIGAFNKISASNYAVYALTGDTNVSVPGVTMPTGTVLKSMTIDAATKDGSPISGFVLGTPTGGLTVADNTGAVSGTPTAIGTYVFTETFTATAATGGSTATRTVTIVVEDELVGNTVDIYTTENVRGTLNLLTNAVSNGVISGDAPESNDGFTSDMINDYIARVSANISRQHYVYIYDGGNPNSLDTNTSYLNKYAAVGANVHNTKAGYAKQLNDSTGLYERVDVAAGTSDLDGDGDMGIAIGSSVDTFIWSNLPAGNYSIPVKLSTKSTVATTSGATGTNASNNSVTYTVRLHVNPQAEFNPSGSTDNAEFWMATNGDYKSLTLSSSLGTDAKFEITEYKTNDNGRKLTSNQISVSQSGAVTPGSNRVSIVDDYELTIKVTDKNNSDNYDTGTLTVHVILPFGFTNNMDGVQYGW